MTAVEGVDRWRDPDTERSVLGDVLLHPDQLHAYRDAGLDADHFSRQAHRLVWHAVSELGTEGVPPDPSAVRVRLDEHRTLDEVTVSYLFGLTDGEPRRTPEGAAHLVAVLDRHRRCRAVYYSSQELIARLAEDPRAIDNGAIPHLIETVAALQAPDIDTRFPLLDDVELLNRPAPTWIVTGRLIQNSLACLYSPPEVGKTTSMVDLGCCIATGRPWLGAATTKGPVVYVAAEGADTIQLKVGAWKRTHGYPLDEPIYFCTIPTAVNLLDAGDTTAFIESIRKRSLTPSLVVFDTVARSMPGGDENSARDMGLLVANADRVRRAFDATVVCVHHTDKQEKGERGSGALRGACDTMMQLMQTDDQLRLFCTKQKDAVRFPPVDVQMVPSGGGCVMRLASDAPRLTGLSDTQQKVLHALRTSFTDDGATTSEWQAAVPDVTERTYHRARKVLIESGYIRTHGQRFAWTGKVPGSESQTLTDMPTDTAQTGTDIATDTQ